ncbi:MAG: SpoIID/LytB domain-containing protein [Acidimicrobiales bacterium]
MFASGLLRRRLGLLAALTVLLTLVVPANPASAASAQAEIEFTGRGWGHGRGMGQWGALGYAQQGWTSAQILDHYYGGTTAGTIPAGAPVNAAAVRVDLVSRRNKSLYVFVPEGTLTLSDAVGTPLPIPATQALLVAANGNGGFTFQTATSCAGPWSESVPLPAGTSFTVGDTNPADTSSGLLAICDGANWTSYSGTLTILDRGVASANRLTGLATVNTTTMQEYLRGVVPKEVSASWLAPALEAQAVAARSYAMAGDTRQQEYADTCDTTTCQVYAGRYRNGVAVTAPSTDAAIAATDGMVRLTPLGTIARTEFSSSTGGYTAGGDFTAVIDEGDSIPANPNSTWTARLSTSTIEARYGLGRLLSLDVTQRNGLDPHGDGGRVLQAKAIFENGSKLLSGQEVRAAFNYQLKSDWFTPGVVYRSDLVGTPTAKFIEGAYQVYTGGPPSSAELSVWYDRLQNGASRAELTSALSKTPQFAGVMVDELYETSLGRAPDEIGSAYWLDIMVGKKTPYAELGIYFYGSQEYYQRTGGSPEPFVRALYRDLLHREPDAAGLAYWVQQMAKPTVSPPDVASGFYVSIESRRDRADRLYLRVLGRPADAAGRDAAAERIALTDDLVVAAELGTSDEFYQSTQS